MIDEVFHQEIEDEDIEEAAEAQSFCIEMFKEIINNNEQWEQLATGTKQDREQFITVVCELGLQLQENMFFINSITQKQ